MSWMPRYVPLTAAEASELLRDVLIEKGTLRPELAHKLAVLDRYHQRDLDVAANFKPKTPNLELQERWGASQATLGLIFKRVSGQRP